MKRSSDDLLRRLGSGEPAGAVCAWAGMTRAEFNAWWKAETADRVPQMEGWLRVSSPDRVEILRDRWGIPHIFAHTEDVLFFGFGFAIAQDRLWQMDYLRRRALGRLAEVLGHEGLPLDVIARTVGLDRIAREQLGRLPGATLHLLEQFSAGVNACIHQREARLPIEFGLLDYAPDPWSPLDSLAVMAEFRWYLTGRLNDAIQDHDARVRDYVDRRIVANAAPGIQYVVMGRDSTLFDHAAAACAAFSWRMRSVRGDCYRSNLWQEPLKKWWARQELRGARNGIPDAG